MSFPSIAIIPLYDISYSRSRMRGTMNLTEYFERREPIGNKILMMQQSYESENG